MSTAAPPSTGTFLSKRLAKKPTQAPSGEKNGLEPPSVPASGRASRLSSVRTYSRRPSASEPATTSVRPSGESASDDAMPGPRSTLTPGGRSAVMWTAPLTGDPARGHCVTATAVTAAVATSKPANASPRPEAARAATAPGVSLMSRA